MNQDLPMNGPSEKLMIAKDDPILVTGGAGFIGRRVAENLRARGFSNVRCFSRKLNPDGITTAGDSANGLAPLQIVPGNLLSPADCAKATQGVRVIYHLAAGTGQKSHADAFLNSVVTTRNLLDAALAAGTLKRFVSVSSFAVYSNRNNPRRGVLDESCPLAQGEDRWRDAYTFAKIKQDELIEEYGRTKGLSYVLLRPGAVYGPGKRSISARVGIGSFGVFLHLGGGNRIPFTYVDNCADAIVLAGLLERAGGHIFNVVDDDLPTSRRFLSQYKKNVRKFRSIYVPRFLSYLLCYGWERYVKYSDGQLPPVYQRAAWHAYWKTTRYPNDKLKSLLGWAPKVPTQVGMQSYFEDCRKGDAHA